MHQLWKHSNGYWYVLYGPRLKRQISTKTKDRREAERFLARFIAVADEPQKAPTVGEILAGYEKAKEGKVRSHDSMKFSVRGLAGLHDLYPTQLKPRVIEDWAKKRGAGAGTILRDVGVLRAGLAWALESQWIAREQVPIISNPVPTPASRKRWLSKDEANKLLNAARAHHLKLFIAMGFATLARMSAILEARWSQVNWERGFIDYGPGHGNKRRAVPPLNDEVLPLLEAAKRLACTSFIIEHNGKPLKTVKRGFAAAVKRAGLSADVTPHVMRHSGASWLLEDGMSDDDVARMLGDTPEMVRRVYGHFRPEYLAKVTKALKFKAEGPE